MHRHSRSRGGAHRRAQLRQRDGDGIEHHQPDRARAQRRQRLAVRHIPAEIHACHCRHGADAHRRRTGNRPRQHRAQETALYAVLIRFERQQKCRKTNCQRGNERQLNRLEGVFDREQQRQQRQGEGIQRFDEEERRRARDVPHDTPPLRDNQRHVRKIRVQERQRRRLFCGIRAARHGNGAVRRLECGNVVHTVARHGNVMPFRLECLDQRLFPRRGHAPEDGVALASIGEFVVR